MVPEFFGPVFGMFSSSLVLNFLIMFLYSGLVLSSLSFLSVMAIRSFLGESCVSGFILSCSSISWLVSLYFQVLVLVYFCSWFQSGFCYSLNPCFFLPPLCFHFWLSPCCVYRLCFVLSYSCFPIQLWLSSWFILVSVLLCIYCVV